MIQVVPAMSLIDTSSPRTAARAPDRDSEGIILLHRDAEASDNALALLSTVASVREASSQPGVKSTLAARGLAGAYFSAHGEGAGPEQYLRLHDGSRISTLSALSLAWTDWVVFASCIVGSLEIEAGTEPAGLAISCLLRGASSIVAGVLEVHMWVADQLCVTAVTRLMNGQHPAEALRAAQLAFLSGRDAASPHRWAGYICISRLPQPNDLPVPRIVRS